MAFQAGDVINFGKLAWQIYQLGWTDEHNATRQYNEFGRDVRGLAESLDVLTRVVHQANSSLQRQGAYNSYARWDPASLRSITGDYELTLHECYELIQANSRYRVGSNALQNIEWNVLVQPSADRLRQRIALHNSKILHVLKPFEIDLLCRVHHDLATRISAVHIDLKRLMGVLIPDLERALDQQAHREIHLLEVPMYIAERFRFAALSDRPDYGSEETFALEELSDAFVMNYNRSTIGFRSGMLVTDRIPPLEQYLNLLKCVWLFERIQSSPSLLNSDTNSHWPSYVRQLEEDLSTECVRFGPELVQPELVTPPPRRDMFNIWPETEPNQLVDVTTQDEMMEKIFEVALERSGKTVERGMTLLRRMGADGRKFRIMISGMEQTATGRPRRQTEVIDFDITSIIINPHYGLPLSYGSMREMVLRRDERIAKLSFQTMNHVLKFQQAVTGYKVWDYHSQYNAMASFVVAGLKDPVVERACIQLWIPKSIDGSLVTNADVAAGPTPGLAPTRTSTVDTSMASSTTYAPTAVSELEDRSTMGRGVMRSPDVLTRSPEPAWSSPVPRHTSPMSVPRKPVPSPSGTMFSTSWSRQMSPPPISCSPPRGPSVFLTGDQHRPPPVPRWTGQSSPPSQPGYLSANANNRSATKRSFSVSTIASTAASNSSGSDCNTVTVSTGSRSTGVLHRRPPKPMLVLFTENSKDGQLSFVTIQMDENTAVNPERCNCRESGSAGAACPIMAIEQSKGNEDLEARRYEISRSGGEMDWNIARLALNNPASSSSAATWPNLNRVSIMFPHSEDRAKFGGTPNQCRCNKKNQTVGEQNKCLELGHRGLWGEVQAHYRKKLIDYHGRRFGGLTHVVNGLPQT